MKKAAIIFSATFLFGCVSQEQLARNQQEINQAKNALDAARLNSSIECKSKPICEKAFSLAKIYVQQNADMKIQFSDETMITTYNPTKYGLVGVSASKILGAGDSATIQLAAICKGMQYYQDNPFYVRCTLRLADIYRGFKPFIESRL